MAWNLSVDLKVWFTIYKEKNPEIIEKAVFGVELD